MFAFDMIEKTIFILKKIKISSILANQLEYIMISYENTNSSTFQKNGRI